MYNVAQQNDNHLLSVMKYKNHLSIQTLKLLKREFNNKTVLKPYSMQIQAVGKTAMILHKDS